MAILTKIRQRSALLIGAIALALFAFIIQDFIGKAGFGENSKNVGTVNGTDISFEDFRIKVDATQKNSENMSATQAANRVWDQEVAIALLTSAFDELGLCVSEKHVIEVLKADKNIGGNPMFLNKAGVFDLAKFKDYFKSNPTQTAALIEREKSAAMSAKYEIYSTLVQAGLYTTASEGKQQYEMETSTVNFSYVAGLYSSINDNQVKVTDEELIDYMKKNEKKYKSDESRAIEYVLVEDKPTAADENEAKTKITALLSEQVVYNQKTAKNDTLPGFKQTHQPIDFVNANSDVPYDSTYTTKKDLPAPDADKLYNLAQGVVYGPYKSDNYYCISRLLERKAGAKVRASHILISYDGTQVPDQKEKRTKAQAQAKAQALLSQIQANPSSFLMLAFSNSDDSSGQQGGDLGYFGSNQMVKPFNDFVFSNPVGKIGLVETDFGFHIIKITDKQDGLRLATVSQKIVPSEATSDQAFTQATQFEMNAADTNFNTLAKKMKLIVTGPITLKAMDEYVGALGNQRMLVKWAFEDDTETGSIKRFELPNIGHVVARLKLIDQSGFIPLDEVRTSITPILKNKKKADLIATKMKGASLEVIAKKVGGKVEQITNITMGNPRLATLGPEPKVVGAAFALPKNKLSKPIEGNNGVYVIKNTSMIKAPVLKDYTAYINKLKENSSRDAGRLLPTLKANATIVDNRGQFNY